LALKYNVTDHNTKINLCLLFQVYICPKLEDENLYKINVLAETEFCKTDPWVVLDSTEGPAVVVASVVVVAGSAAFTSFSGLKVVSSWGRFY
jgi:hypothetical protein